MGTITGSAWTGSGLLPRNCVGVSLSLFRYPSGMGEDLRLVRRPTAVGKDLRLFGRSTGVGEDLSLLGCGGARQRVTRWRATARVSRVDRAAGFLTAERPSGGSARFVGAGGSGGCGRGMISTDWAVAER
jgi:hypothetical protein